MVSRQLVSHYLRAFQDADPRALHAILHDDFELDHYALPTKVDKESCIELAEALADGIPDGHLETRYLQPHLDGSIIGMTGFTGTHTETLDLRCVGLPRLPATGKRIDVADERGRWTLQDDRLLGHVAERPESGGLLQALLPNPLASLFTRDDDDVAVSH